MKTIFALVMTALLSACGGGGDDQLEDRDRSIGPPDCVAKPAACI